MTHPSDDPVGQLGAELAPDAVEFMRGFGSSPGKDLFEDSPDPVSPAQREAAELEGMVFYLHVIDRVASERFGAIKRRIFMDALLEGVSAHFESLGFNSGRLRDLFNERQVEYSSFKKLYHEEGENLKGTLCWEFAKSITLKFGGLNPVRMTLIARSALDLIGSYRKIFQSF